MIITSDALSEIQAVWRRLRSRYLRVRNEPTLLVMLVAVLVGAALALIDMSVRLQQVHAGKWRHLSEAAISSPLEPRENTTNYGILAAIIDAIPKSERRDQLCSTGELNSCKVAARLHKSASIVFYALDDVVPGMDCNSDEGQGNAFCTALAAVGNTNLPGGRGGWKWHNSGKFVGVPPKNTSSPADINPYEKCESGLKTAHCRFDAATGVTYYIPAPIREQIESRRSVAEMVENDAAIQHLLGMLVGIHKAEIEEATTQRSKRQLVQAYMISAGHTLAIWNSRGESMIGALPATRYWAAASYFEPVWTGDSQYFSAPYLDLGGNGVVETECHPLTSQDLGYSGVFCTDLAFSDDALLEVAESFTRDNQIERTEVWFTSSGVDFEKSDDFFDPVSKGQFETSVIARLARRASDPIENPLTQVTVYELGQGKVYAVPISKRGGRTKAWVFRIGRAEIPNAAIACLTSGLACALLAVFVMIFGHRAMIELTHFKSSLAQLRSLPTGVVKTNEEDMIVEINDRARELLQLSSAELEQITGVNFGTTANSVVTDFVESVGDDFARIDAQRIRTIREGGGVSRYFARVRRTQQWIRVDAGPFVVVSDSDNAVETFGTVVKVSKAMSEKLNARYKSL